MILYALLPDHSQKTGHYVIDDPNKPAHEERVDLTRILIIEGGKGEILLNSYQADGKWEGDSLHHTIEEAKNQADFEYEGISIKWVEIPEGVSDPVQYALEAARKN